MIRECRNCGSEVDLAENTPANLTCQSCGYNEIFFTERGSPITLKCCKCNQFFKIQPFEVFYTLLYKVVIDFISKFFL